MKVLGPLFIFSQLRRPHVLSVVCVLGILLTASPSHAATWPIDLESRLNQSLTIMRNIMEAPDRGIPRDLLRQSRGIILIPEVLKAGLGVGASFGKGVALARDPRTGKWGPPIFISLYGGSFGWQIGVQSTDVVLLIMSDAGLRNILKDKVTIGADASVAAGPVGRNASAGTDAALSAGILSYSHSKGLFAGVSIKGSVLEIEWSANENYYGPGINIRNVVDNHSVPLSPSARRLVRYLNRF